MVCTYTECLVSHVEMRDVTERAIVQFVNGIYTHRRTCCTVYRAKRRILIVFTLDPRIRQLFMTCNARPLHIKQLKLFPVLNLVSSKPSFFYQENVTKLLKSTRYTFFFKLCSINQYEIQFNFLLFKTINLIS